MNQSNLTQNIYHKRDNCRLCSSKDLKLVIEMGNSPISEKYVTKKNIEQSIPKVPLDLFFCKQCTHLQLLHVVNPDFLWSNFTFKTSRDEKLIAHFKNYVEKIIKIKNIKHDDLIIDVGSNDGTLLKCFIESGYNNVLGVDPADEIADRANKNGIETLKGYMNEQMAKNILKTKGKAKIITANNVFAHADDLKQMLTSINSLMDDDTIFVFEVSYLLDVVEKMLIGTIFHEHLCYHSVKALNSFLASHDLELFHVARGPEQGGSIIGYVQKKNGSIKKKYNTVQNLLLVEKNFGLEKISKFDEMNKKLILLKKNLCQKINEIKSQKKNISGFGAARSGTTFISFFEIGKYIDLLFDDNEDKHYKFSPGDKIQVLPTKEIYKIKPDYLIIFAWIHADKIIQNNQKFLDQGGSFIRFFPRIEIIKK